MREIIYRGKDRTGIMNHSWQVGALDNTNAEFPKIIRLDRCGNQMIIDVAPETVGQFTGLTDKNGKKIFEGDIVKNEHRRGQYQYFKIFYDTRVYCFMVENKYGMLGFLYNVIGDLEVIGSVHDNPELLKGGEE